MSSDKRDSALSEVIGMLLIIAILVAAMSVYITYMVPEKGKAAEIRHMNDVRSSFLELSYLVHSLWVNGQTGVSVATPVSLRSTTEPSALPVFTPVSSQGVLSITNVSETDDTFTVRFLGFSAQRVSAYSPSVIERGQDGISLNSTPYEIRLGFMPNIGASPRQGVIATLTDEKESIGQGNFYVDFELRHFGTVASEDRRSFLRPDGETTDLAFTNATYRHSLVARDRNSKLEYVVIDNVQEQYTEVNIKPILDLFPGIRLVKNSWVKLIEGGTEEDSALTYGSPRVIISYGATGVPLGTASATSPLTDITFTAGNYYWVDQQFRYQKGAVFLLQDYLDPGLTNSTSLSDAAIRVAPFDRSIVNSPLVVSVADIDIHRKNQRMSTSGGTAQIISEISVIENRLCQETTGICYDSSDGTAGAVQFVVESDDIDTLRRWNNMLGRVCNLRGDSETCPEGGDRRICELVQNPGRVTLTVEPCAGDERLSVQYTKVVVDMEIRS